MISRDDTWLRLAAQMATRSHDLRTQNGCVLAIGDHLIAAGANRYPVSDWRLNLERNRPPEKYTYIEHAEREAIYEAARYGQSAKNATLYAVWAACPECARAIIASGVVRVVTLLATRIATPERWCEQIRIADAMLSDAGVAIELASPRLGIAITFNGSRMDL